MEGLVAEFKTLELGGNFKVNNKILADNLQMYRELMSVRTIDEAVFEVEVIIKESPLVSKSEWLSEKHMKLKQLTVTSYSDRTINLPEPLRTCWEECLLLNDNDMYLDRLLSVMSRKATPNSFISVSNYKLAMAKLGLYAKKNSDRWLNFSRYTDLDLFVGYDLEGALTLEEKEGTVSEWGGPGFRIFEHNDEMFQGYQDRFLKVLLARFNAAFNSSRLKKLSISEFISLVQPWMTDGSSKGVRVDIKVDGRVVKSNAKKQVLAMKFTLSQLSYMCFRFNYDSETLSVSEKIEPGRKGRLIISADFVQQIRLAYLEYCLGTTFKHAFPEIWAFQGSKLQKDIQVNLLKLTKDPNLMCFPMDASKFDQFIDKTEISSVFLAIREVALKFSNWLHPDFFSILDMALYVYFNCKVVVGNKKILNKWSHGIPSGIRWTSALGGIINCVRFMVCLKDLRPQQVIVDNYYFQGDDMAVFIRRNIDAIYILDWYKTANIPIHATKNFLTMGVMEFLRKIYTVTGQTGYQNRVLTKFCFRVPENRGARDTYSMLVDRVTNLARMSARANNAGYFLVKVNKILGKILSGQNINLITVLTTPNMLGGFGFIPAQSKYSARTRRLLSKFDWDSPRDVEVLLYQTGLFGEICSMASAKFGVKTFDNMLSGIKNALNPFPSVTMSNIVKVSSYEYKFRGSINTKINFRLGVPATFRPWMPDDSNLSIVTADVILHLVEEDKIDDIRQITNSRVLPTFDLYRQKFTKNLFKAWLLSELDPLTFLNMNMDDTQRKFVSDVVLGTLFIRFVNSHAEVNMSDYKEVLLFSYFYICANIDFIITNVLVYKFCD